MQLTHKPLVLIVDDAPDNLMLIKMLLQDCCQVIQASNGIQALQLAQQTPLPDLILLDVLMPEMDGYAVCLHLKEMPSTREIPVIFLTSRNLAEDQRRGFQAGAVDYITKPINPDVLQARVNTHLQLQSLHAMLKDQGLHLEHLLRQRTQDLLAQQGADLLQQAAALQDAPAVCRLQDYVAALARQLQSQPNPAYHLNDEDITLLFQATALYAAHTRIPAESLAAMDHASQNFLRFAKEMTQASAEKFDGSGQPQGLCGNQIPLAARIVQAALVYDNLIHDHDYKPALSHEQALAVLREQRGSHFDPVIVDAACNIGNQFQAIAQQYVLVR